MRADNTADRLAALLPFPADHPIAVLGWPELSGAALAIRPDLEALAVRSNHGDDRWRTRLARSDASARPVDVTEVVALEPSHVLVEVAGAGPTQVLVADGTEAVLADLARPSLVVWLVAGVGRVLPARMFEAMTRRLGDPEDHGFEILDVQIADRIAGPTGLVRPEHLIRRVDSPVAPELLRLS
jgi:hypothetical protein